MNYAITLSQLGWYTEVINPKEERKMTETKRTPHYRLREMEQNDAEALLRCYGDPEAVKRMNADNCNQGSFLVPDLESMRSAIRLWSADPDIVRLTIEDADAGCAVGTVEYCRKDHGRLVLRLDLCSDRERQKDLLRIVGLACEEGFKRYPDTQNIVTKAFPQDGERRAALTRYGFGEEIMVMGFPHYFEVRPFRGVAYCGLVCAYCSEQNGCPGCKRAGCKDRAGCKPYCCGVEKGHGTCADCPQFPCDAPILRSLRMRAFAAYAHAHGEETLLAHLSRKAAQGVQYHREGLAGDYDGFDSEEELIRFLES